MTMILDDEDFTEYPAPPSQTFAAKKFRSDWRNLGMPASELAKRLTRLGHFAGPSSLVQQVKDAAGGGADPSGELCAIVAHLLLRRQLLNSAYPIDWDRENDNIWDATRDVLGFRIRILRQAPNMRWQISLAHAGGFSPDVSFGWTDLGKLKSCAALYAEFATEEQLMLNARG